MERFGIEEDGLPLFLDRDLSLSSPCFSPFPRGEDIFTYFYILLPG